MLYYIIDGYNLINSLPLLKNKSSLEEKRRSLINLISKYKLTGSPHNKVMIVFDGKDEFTRFQKVFDFEVVFTNNKEKADDFIIKKVEESKNPRIIIVVSDDRELCFKVKRRRALTLSVKDFFAPLFRKDEKRVPDKFMLSPKQIKMINQELKRLWLRED